MAWQTAGVGPSRSFNGSAWSLNLNVHIHALVIDGVFARDREGLGFHPACRLTRDDVAEVVAVIGQRIDRLLQRRGLAAEESRAADTWADEAPTLAGLAAASVQGLIALGPRAGARVARFGSAAVKRPL
jgi:hypothetical protein